MKILVIGSGGREHALAWKFKQSPHVNKIFCLPGNAGMAELGECLDIAPDDFLAIADFAKKKRVDWTIVGPEKPLVSGIVDVFEKQGLNIFGPNKKAAIIEGSKVFSKRFMQKYGIPTASFKIFDRADSAEEYLDELSPSENKPVVVKADGLAAGKGVIIVKSREEGKKAIEKIMVKKIFGAAGKTVLIEEFLEGEEATVLVLSDGENILPLVSSRDHKKIYDGEKGPNTGGMGAYAPDPVITEELFKDIEEKILRPTIDGLAKEGSPYRGVLYVGLIITAEGPKVLEYNVRFGDPETQAVLPLLESDLADLLPACRQGGGLKDKKLKWQKGAAICVILASKGYPGEYEKGKVIEGLEQLTGQKQVMVFQAGTKLESGPNSKLVTEGGRVLGITAWDSNIEAAIKKVYRAVDCVRFEGMQFRQDIGQKAIKI